MKRLITLSLLFSSLLAGKGVAQDNIFTFGVTWRSRALSQLPDNQSAVNINEGDVLTFGQGAPATLTNLPNPARTLSGASLGLTQYQSCQDHQPNSPCGIEIDAFTQGKDTLLQNNLFGPATGLGDLEDLWFSTDEYAVGQVSLTVPPNVLSEGAAAGDISADVWVVTGLGPGPIGPSPAALGVHVGVFDGNSLPSQTSSMLAYPGIGLTEPNTPGANPPDGDNLDSLNIEASAGFPPEGYFISVDSTFADPLTNIQNSGTSVLQVPPVSGADVLLVIAPGANPFPWAPASALGLDLAGVNTDDIDALVIARNHIPGFQASQVEYDWTDGSTDMVLFSVRRGSAVIGAPDSIFGMPIEPGDVLTTPRSSASGGVSPFPGIMYSAESIGLATSRTNNVAFGDDLNALDFASRNCLDCNNNGVEDAIDISVGTSTDTDGNGIPDECERISKYCFCDAAIAPCANQNSSAGCGNGDSSGALLDFTGTNRVSLDNLVLVATGVPFNKNGLFYMGGGQTSVALGNGVRCVAGRGTGTFRFSPTNSGSSGVLTLSGVISSSCGSWPGTACISPGDTWNFQAWYRDGSGPCSQPFNFSNGISVEFVP